jgi:hypothetical protein
MEFRAIVWPVLDGLWKSYTSATKDFATGELRIHNLTEYIKTLQAK